MLGISPKRRGLFDARPQMGLGILPGDQPEIDMGDFPPHNLPQTNEAPRRKGGLFAQGGTGRAIAGMIGDVLLQRGGLQPIYAPAMRAQHERLLAEQERETERADWVWKENWKRENPSATDTVDIREDNAGNIWRFDKRTGQPIGDKPTWVDTVPKEFVHEGMRFSIANPFANGQSPTSNIPKVTDQASYDAVPAGSQFYDDKGILRTKQGGPASQAPAGFPGGY